MDGKPRVTRLLAGLAVTFLLVGCASGATASHPSPAVPTATSLATSTPTPTAPALASNPSGQMTVGRVNHTATPLADGRVLLAGGFRTGLVSLASAEIYNPENDTFSATGSMTTRRESHTATLLADGRVLVTDNYPSPDLYDPKTGTFSPTGSMAIAASGKTATLLADGRVLVTGGCADPEIATAELYDPKTGTFSPTGSMAAGRERHTATLLADGRVLVTGGMGDLTTGLASAELYDPKTGTFSPTGPMAGTRVLQTATLLSDGRVLVTGGAETIATGGSPLASAELYDPKTGTFSPTGSMATARVGYTATLLADGRVLVAGGQADSSVENAPGPPLASAELYDPKSGTFSPTGPMATARARHAATLLADGRVLAAGGVETFAVETGPGPSLASAELYDPKSGTFSPTGP